MKLLNFRISLILTLLFISFNHLACGQAWTSLKEVPVKLSFPVVVELNGDIHVIGGGGPDGATDIHLRYTINTDSWDTLAPVPYKAQQPSGVSINGGIHYYGGGYPNTGSPLKLHYRYDPASNTWSRLPDLPINRAIHVSQVVGDSIFIMAGQPEKTRVDIYRTTDSTWHSPGALPDVHVWYGALARYGDDIYRFGGGGFAAPTSNAHRYRPETNQWTTISSLTMGLHAASAATLGDSIYIVGGFSDLKYLTQCLVYNPMTDQYGKGPSLPVERSYHAVVRVGSCLYSVGGNNNPDNVGTSLIRHCQGDAFTNSGVHTIEAASIDVRQTIDGEILLISEGVNSPLNLRVYSLDGKQIWQDVILPNQPISPVNLPETIHPGIYVLSIEQDGMGYKTKLHLR